MIVLGRPRIVLFCVWFFFVHVRSLLGSGPFFLSSFIVMTVPFLFSTKERNCSLFCCSGLTVRERGVA